MPWKACLPAVPLLLLVVGSLPHLRGQSSPPLDPVAVDWVRRNAHPVADVDTATGFADLQPLKAMIGNARIVGLGEGTHGTHEFVVMKRRLIEFLAREMGFTLFAMEGNLPESGAINDYVRTGQGDPAALVKGLTFWTWTTEELTNIVTWMRQFRSEGGRMEFHGVDVQLPAAGQRVVVEALKRVDPAWAARVEATYARLASPDQQFGLAYVPVPAAAYAGRTITLRAWVRSADAGSRGGSIHLRADDARGEAVVRATSTGSNAAPGTTAWKQVELSLDVPRDATTLRVGFVLFGVGRAWFDSAVLSAAGAGAPAPLTLTFDDDASSHVTIDPRSVTMPYAIERDGDAGHESAGSLRIARTGPAVAAGADAIALAQEVLTGLETGRAALEQALTADGAAWTLYNARFVRQSFEWRNDPSQLSREVSMAQNTRWLLDRAPAGTKAIIYAHNEHVSRNPIALGARLEELYPGQMVTIGFATRGGRYRAEGPGGTPEFDLMPPPPGSVESYLAAASIPRFMLDTRRARPDDAASSWLLESRLFRFIGITGSTSQFRPQPVGRRFDVLIYLDQTRPSTLLR